MVNWVESAKPHPITPDFLPSHQFENQTCTAQILLLHFDGTVVTIRQESSKHHKIFYNFEHQTSKIMNHAIIIDIIDK